MTETPSHPKLLVADDNEDVRHLLGILLGHDYDIVAVACDGIQALEGWYTHRDELFAVVLDHRMPHMTGLQLARRILADDPAMRVVLFSAELDPALTEAAAGLGVDVVAKTDLTRLTTHPALSPRASMPVPE